MLYSDIYSTSSPFVHFTIIMPVKYAFKRYLSLPDLVCMHFYCCISIYVYEPFKMNDSHVDSYHKHKYNTYECILLNANKYDVFLCWSVNSLYWLRTWEQWIFPSIVTEKSFQAALIVWSLEMWMENKVMLKVLETMKFP